MTDTKINISFLKINNAAKGICKPHDAADVDPNWLEERASKKDRADWNEYIKHYESVGVTHPKVKYPVMFGRGKNQFPGIMAIDDI